jgi:peptidoglycan hydrolase-like protein with peptidoglycan-binding domain
MATAATAVPLHLSSPPMEGADVAQAQRLLLHNSFGTFDPGPIDGVYGERTAAAVRRAKYWLGYPERLIDEIASPDLVAMLAGGVAQPPSFKAAHTRRLRRAQDVGLWNSAYDVAISNVGERETPAGSRRIECTDWYGVPAPWAAIFVSWCYARAGSTAFQAAARYAYVPHMLWDAQRGVNQLSVTRRPLPGDLPVFDLDGDGIADHVAMFDDWTGQPGTTFCTIEGNVSTAGEPNGGRIAQLERRADHRVLAFVHVRG